jgi:general secretion pathway protein H
MSATGEPARPQRAKARADAGSTLAEALVVVAITAAISAIAYPNLRQGLGHAAFVQASAGVAADLRMAHAQALSTGAEVDIQVAPDGSGYGWTPGPQRALVEGLSLAPTGVAVRFYPDGSAAGEPLELNNGRAMARFAADPATGVVGPGA